MPVTGKTGADAIFKSLQHICRVLVAYNLKLNTLIDDLEAATTISAGQAAVARTLLSDATAFCAAFEIIAQNSGF